jgi:UDP-N-acetyl-D-glucosamine/UDP-N-acetyl-D-galactosamine dehydrogenase
MTYQDKEIAIVGLGYVGLPLAVAFGKKYKTIGFDINQKRIEELKEFNDRTLEVTKGEIKKSQFLEFTSNQEQMRNCSIYVVTVPTPIDTDKTPDLSAIRNASQLVGNLLSKGDYVIYESTVYPGVTEEICVPILEEYSGLKFNHDFFCGYSPERINPGDKNHRVEDIVKVTSGSTKEAANVIDKLYSSIITAGTFKASSIKVAEAAKVIENTQRDINIALINELSIVFDTLNIDTKDVLEAAETKWNFINFKPGLVGGHCIGVDPYYLTYKAIKSGYTPEIILTGRKLNDDMGKYVSKRTLDLLNESNIAPKDSNILIMGFSFKENCPDIRNSLVFDLYSTIKKDCNFVDVFDPWVDPKEAKEYYDLDIIDAPKRDFYDAIIIAIAHQEFLDLGIEEIRRFGKNNSIIFDIKSIFDSNDTDGRL